MLIKYIIMLYVITPDFNYSLSIKKDIDTAKQFLKHHGIPEPDLCKGDHINVFCPNTDQEVCSARLVRKKMEFKQFENPCYMDLKNFCDSQDNIWSIKNFGPCVMDAELRRFAKEIEKMADNVTNSTESIQTNYNKTTDDDRDETATDDTATEETAPDGETTTDDEEVTETSPDDETATENNTTDENDITTIVDETATDETETQNNTTDKNDKTTIVDETATDETATENNTTDENDETTIVDETATDETATENNTTDENDETTIADETAADETTTDDNIAEDATEVSGLAEEDDDIANDDTIAEDENATIDDITTDAIVTNTVETTIADDEIGRIYYDDGSFKPALREGNVATRFPPLKANKTWDKIPCVKRVKCPNIFFPVCLYFGKEMPNNISYYHFINKCEAQQYTCYHPERKIEGSSSMRAGFCAHIRSCMEEEETAAHVILTCPGVAEYRAKHLGTPGSLPEAVGSIKGLLGFLVELGWQEQE